MSNLRIVILAAGNGSRMGSSLPKVMHHLAGRPMIEHVVRLAYGIKKEIFNNLFSDIENKLPSIFTAADIYVVYNQNYLSHLQTVISTDYGVNFVPQKEQLGTGHAVAQVLPFCKDDDCLLVLLGDSPLVDKKSIKDLLSYGIDSSAKLSLLTSDLTDPTGFGRVVRDHDTNKVILIRECIDANEEEKLIKECFSGILLVRAENFKKWFSRINLENKQREYYLTSIIKEACADNLEVLTVKTNNWYEAMGANDLIQLEQLEQYYRLSRSKHYMRQGVRLADASRVEWRGDVDIGKESFIDVGVVLDNVVIGEKVEIGPYCVIRNSKIGDGTKIKPHTVIDSAEIDDNCNLGPFAHIRPGTKLSESVKVGNFVEIKNVTVGSSAKIGHLSYLGDAKIGNNVNIGASTVTCNYDGVQKYLTIIEDGAFVGSNVSLVAPVVIKDHAVIGAGSTITKEAPSGQLTLTRVKQTSIKRWKQIKHKIFDSYS